MKPLLKLALAALIVNAVWRVGSEYVSHMRFRDAVRAATIDAASSDERLRTAIAEEADRLGVPISAKDVSITRAERRIDVAGAYTKPILLAPGYDYPWTFNWEVEVFVAPSITQPSAR